MAPVTRGAFTTTHSATTVLVAGQNASPKAGPPRRRPWRNNRHLLYIDVRRLGQSAEDAQVSVQGFFARLLEKNYLKDADPAKGRVPVRSF